MLTEMEAAQVDDALVETPVAEEVAPEPMATDVEVAVKEVAVHEAEIASENDTAKTLTENGVGEGVAGDAVASAENTAEAEVVVSEVERIWSVVKSNPADFNSWISLIHETEKIGDLVNLRRVYDEFLAEFPLCYGYWKKYADHEAKLGGGEKCTEIYERAVGAVAYSVDMWAHYSAYYIEHSQSDGEITGLFERGLAYVGTDYLAHLLWDKYLEYLISKEDWRKAAEVYTRILQIPLQQLDRYYQSFKQFASSHALDQLRTSEEAAAAAEEGSELGEKVTPDGEPEPPATAELAQVDATPAESKKPAKTEAEQLEDYLAVREALYKASKERDGKIRDFETLIKRPYFHVKPLDDLQLTNWHRYLDFVENEGDFEKIVKLYERCLIPCANYPEYWLRYVERMEADNSLERAMEALLRATTVFVKRRPEIHLFAAQCQELWNQADSARDSYGLVIQLAPGLLEAIVRRANFEHRQGHSEAACALYEAVIDVEKAKETVSHILPMICFNYARFLDLVLGKPEEARAVYKVVIEKLPTSKAAWQAAISFEASQSGPDRGDKVFALCEQSLAATKPDGTPALTLTDREEICGLSVELADLFGGPKLLKLAKNRQAALFPNRRAPESKKRSSHDSSLQERNSKQHKTYSGAGQYGGYPAGSPAPYGNGQPDWGAGTAYGQQPAWQGRPAGPQGQEAWGAAYPQQSQENEAWQGYGYNSYAGYSAPPQPAAPVTYPAYGQGYPPQAYPPAAYAAPAPAPAAAPVAAAPAPAPYYPPTYYAQ